MPAKEPCEKSPTGGLAGAADLTPTQEVLAVANEQYDVGDMYQCKAHTRKLRSLTLNLARRLEAAQSKIKALNKTLTTAKIIAWKLDRGELGLSVIRHRS
jgi:hypothetical protein